MFLSDLGRTDSKPGHFWKIARMPGQGPKKRTCPGKPGRMVTLIVLCITFSLCCLRRR